MNQTYIDNLTNDAVALKKETQATNLKTAVTNYMSVLAAGSPDNCLPNGMTAEQAAESAINGAEYYVRVRNQQLNGEDGGMELTAETVREQIARQLENLSVEQGIQYVAMLKLMYRYFMPAEEIDMEQAMNEYRQMTRFYGDKSPEEQLDDLIDSFEVRDLHSVLHFAEGLSVDLEAGELDERAMQMVRQAMQNYMEVEDAVICGVIMYGEAVKGHVEDLSPASDPGVVTVVSAAYLDALHSCSKQEYAEFLYRRLSLLGKILASALTVATAGLVAVWACTLAPEIMTVAAALGASDAVAKSVGILFYIGVCVTQLPMCDDYKIMYSDLIGAVERMIQARRAQPVAAESEVFHNRTETHRDRELLAN